MSYKIDLGIWGRVFAVPTSVVDKGLKLSSDTQLKVLLYILRHGGETLTDESVAEALSVHPEDVRDAIEYWQDKGLIAITSDAIIVPETNASESKTSEPVTNTAAEETSKTQKPRPVSRATKPEPAYVAKRLRMDKNIVFLMDEAQRILSKVFSNSDTATLLMLHDTDGLPIEVILMLLEHCVQIGKGNMRYIERTGIAWAHEGITTINLAEEKIKRYSESTEAWNTVAAVFGLHLGGTPTKKQLEFADVWVNTYKFSENMLRFAYEKCVDTKGELNMSYINGILRRWNEQGMTKPEDVHKADLSQSAGKNKTTKETSVKSDSYDLDAYAQSSIFDD